MGRHNREGQGADQRGYHYAISFQPDWLRHVKVTRDLETGRQSTKTLFRNPAVRGEAESGDRIRTRIVSRDQGVDFEVVIGDPFRAVKRIRVAYEILRCLGLRSRGPEIISCPTCGRCEIDLFSIVDQVENALSGMVSSPKLAIMGCVFNGPGEAREADVGVAGGRGQGILFKKGEVVKKIPENRLAEVLIEEVKRIVD